jgi:cephalosporin-C deacetylase-like acetyl esterase
MFDFITEGYEKLWKSIIRPPRETYTNFELGPSVFSIDDYDYKRTDFDIVSSQGYRICCSHFEPVDEQRNSEVLPCVIYLHGNSSSRPEAQVLIPLVLPSRATVMCFDWAGCGRSEGEYITLGWNERLDLDLIINYLREHRRVGCIGLCGRSMGAVTALFSACNNLNIGSMVLDSPFTSMKKLCYELAQKNSSAPKFILKFIYNQIRKTIKTKAGFDINLLNPIELAPKCFQPALFITAKNDDFVEPYHTQAMYQAYAGDKDILYVNGDHNSHRPSACLEKIGKFFYSTLLCDKIPRLVEVKPKKKRSGEAVVSEEEMLKWAIEESLVEYNKFRGSIEQNIP